MLLTKLRRELRFNGELLSLVDTLKNIAGSQYHVMEKEKERFERFMEAFADFFRVVNLADVEHPLASVASDVTGVVIVTSDSGFMGGLNQGVTRAAFARVADVPADKVSLVVVGDKGAGYMRDQRREFTAFAGIPVEQAGIYSRAVEIKNFLVHEVLEGRMGRVAVAYPRALSFTAQTIETVELLPCGALFDRAAASEISRRTRLAALVADAHKVCVESPLRDLLEYLASMWVTSKLFEVFEDSKLAEFSARAMHLEGSVQKVDKEHKKLKRMCSKASHEAIDKGMREGFAARSISKKRNRKVGAA